MRMTQAQFDELERNFDQLTKYLVFSRDYAGQVATVLPDSSVGEIMTVLVNWQGETYPPSLNNFLKRTEQHVFVGAPTESSVQEKPPWEYYALPVFSSKPILYLMKDGTHLVSGPGQFVDISKIKAWMPIPEE